METKTFEVKEEHLKLLHEAYVDWNHMEHGAPSIDPKRPYGDSFVYKSLATILQIRPGFDLDWSKEDYAYMDKMHNETKIALQIFLRTGVMETGLYEASKYSSNWRKI
jgi:hypothetical protein